MNKVPDGLELRTPQTNEPFCSVECAFEIHTNSLLANLLWHIWNMKWNVRAVTTAAAGEKQ